MTQPVAGASGTGPKAGADADYKAAQKACDAKTGTEKDDCLTNAKAAYDRALGRKDGPKGAGQTAPADTKQKWTGDGSGRSPTPYGKEQAMKSILDPEFRYTPSVDTDLRKTFARIRREQQRQNEAFALAEGEARQKVLPITARRQEAGA